MAERRSARRRWIWVPDTLRAWDHGVVMGGYDIIGDVHGHWDRLEALLRHLGYVERDGAWRCADRTAVFVGDLIDTGPHQREVLRVVRSMIDAGTARAVLGNHEFNAVAWATRHPLTGEACRPDTPKNRAQHEAFLAQIGEGSTEHREWIEWFMTLPVWLDLGGVRVVHACWDPAAMWVLAPRLGPGHVLTQEVIVESADRRTSSAGESLTVFEAVEHLLKGPEVALPEGAEYADRRGHCRRRARFKWWDPGATTLRSGALIPPGVAGCEEAGEVADANLHSALELPDTPIVDRVPPPYTDEVPVVFGHYWCDDRFEVIGPTALCVDYSAGRGGPLAVYRWSGETELSDHHLVRVGVWRR